MKQSIYKFFFAAVVAMVSVGNAFAQECPPNDEIWYEATSKLVETTSSSSIGLHTNAFNTTITSHTFAEGKGVIKFNGDVTDIGKYAFRDGGDAYGSSSSLTSITIPNSVTEIGSSAFSSCKSLTSVAIPDSVKIIYDRTFRGCTNLNYITIGKSVTSIWQKAFSGCRLIEVECLAQTPATISYKSNATTNSFSDATFRHALLSIPVNTFLCYVYDSNWYYFNNIREQATSTEDLSNKQVYALKNRATRNYLVYDAVNEKTRELGAASLNDEALSQHWQIVSSHGQQFLYNLGAKKYAYVQANGEIVMSDTPVAITITNNEKGIQLGHQGQWSFVLNNTLAISDVVGINDVDANGQQPTASAPIYNLSGQRISTPKKGEIYIQGGKVVKF